MWAHTGQLLSLVLISYNISLTLHAVHRRPVEFYLSFHLLFSLGYHIKTKTHSTHALNSNSRIRLHFSDMAAKKTELTCNMFQFAYEKKTTQLQKLKHLRLQLAEVNAFYTNGIIELHQSGCGLSNTTE